MIALFSLSLRPAIYSLYCIWVGYRDGWRREAIFSLNYAKNQAGMWKN